MEGLPGDSKPTDGVMFDEDPVEEKSPGLILEDSFKKNKGKPKDVKVGRPIRKTKKII